MKTSNKILTLIGLTLLASPFINAYSLKQKLINKEYTLLKNRNEIEMKSIDFMPTDSIHIIGGNNLLVEITQSDSASVKIGKKTPILVYEENGVLIVQYSEDHNPDSSNPARVIIRTPSINAISVEGKLITYSKGTQYRKTVTSYYSPFEITVDGFKAEKMNIHVRNGGGSINFNKTRLDKLSLSIGEMSNFKIDEKSHISSMDVHAAKNSTININKAHIHTLKTNLDPTASLTLKGNNITNIIPYE